MGYKDQWQRYKGVTTYVYILCIKYYTTSKVDGTTFMVYHGPENLQIATFYLGKAITIYLHYGVIGITLENHSNRLHTVHTDLSNSPASVHHTGAYGLFTLSYPPLPFHPFCFDMGLLNTTVDGSEIPNNHLGCIKPCK